MNNYLLWENTNRNETFSDFVCLKIRERQLNEVAFTKALTCREIYFQKCSATVFIGRQSKQL